MTIAEFDKHVLIEQIRYLEEQGKLSSDADDGISSRTGAPGDFDDRLWQRATALRDRNGLERALAHPARLNRLVSRFALLAAALLGAFASVFALTDTNTINIYWLLLVLLGFNMLSMLLWLVGISLNVESLFAGVLAKLSSWLPGRLRGSSPSAAPSDHAWLACHYAGRVGKWQLSVLTHQLWLAYLIAGLALLIVVLMARQYDFVWGTTLLSEAVFMQLTETLSAPLQALGLTTPSVQQVQDTRVGAQHSLTPAHRAAWAQFLLGALLCFGVLPRLLLCCWAVVMRRIARRRFAPDYYLPYYISLRQELVPLAGHGEIIDPDATPPAEQTTSALHPDLHAVPEGTLWVAVELGEDIDWPPACVDAKYDLGMVVDRETLTSVQQSLHSKTTAALAVTVSATRVPDRGVQRTIRSLFEGRAQCWLVLLQTDAEQALSERRLQDWYRLAEACAIPVDRVISMTAA